MLTQRFIVLLCLISVLTCASLHIDDQSKVNYPIYGRQTKVHVSRSRNVPGKQRSVSRHHGANKTTGQHRSGSRSDGSIRSSPCSTDDLKCIRFPNFEIGTRFLPHIPGLKLAKRTSKGRIRLRRSPQNRRRLKLKSPSQKGKLLRRPINKRRPKSSATGRRRKRIRRSQSGRRPRPKSRATGRKRKRIRRPQSGKRPRPSATGRKRKRIRRPQSGNRPRSKTTRGKAKRIRRPQRRPKPSATGRKAKRIRRPKSGRRPKPSPNGRKRKRIRRPKNGRRPKSGANGRKRKRVRRPKNGRRPKPSPNGRKRKRIRRPKNGRRPKSGANGRKRKRVRRPKNGRRPKSGANGRKRKRVRRPKNGRRPKSGANGRKRKRIRRPKNGRRPKSGATGRKRKRIRRPKNGRRPKSGANGRKRKRIRRPKNGRRPKPSPNGRKRKRIRRPKNGRRPKSGVTGRKRKRIRRPKNGRRPKSGANGRKRKRVRRPKSGRRPKPSPNGRKRKRIRRPKNGRQPRPSATSKKRKRIRKPQSGKLPKLSTISPNSKHNRRPKYEVLSRRPQDALAECRKPVDILHGRVQTPPSYIYGSKSVYSCKDGYQLEGIATHVCQSDGKWSASPPACVKKSKLEKDKDLKDELNRIEDDFDAMKNSTTGTSLILGMVAAMLALLFLLTCHCMRVLSTRGELRVKHAEVVDKGLVPAREVPGVMAISNGLIKKCLCCDSGLPTSFGSRKSKSRLSTTSVRGVEDGSSSKLSARRSKQGSLQRVVDFERLSDSSFPVPPEGIDYGIPDYEAPRHTSSRNRQDYGVDFNSLKHYKNDNASLQQLRRYWPTKYRHRGDTQQVRYTTFGAPYFQDDIVDLSDRRKTTRSKNNRSRQPPKSKSSEPSISSKAKSKFAQTKKEYIRKRSTNPTRYPYRNINMNTNVDEVANPTTLPLYNASQSFLTYRDYLQNACRRDEASVGNLLTGDEIITAARQYYLPPSNYDFYSSTSTDALLKTNVDGKVENGSQCIYSDQGTTDFITTIEGTDIASKTQNGVKQTRSHDGFMYGIFNTTINFNDNDEDLINENQTSKQMGITSSNTNSDLYHANTSRSKNDVDTNSYGVQDHVDKKKSDRNKEHTVSEVGTYQTAHNKGITINAHSYGLDENDNNSCDMSEYYYIRGLNTERQKLQYVLGEDRIIEPSQEICNSEDICVQLDIPEDKPNGQSEDIQHGDISADSSKTLVMEVVEFSTVLE